MANEQQPKTVFQKLNRLFTPNGVNLNAAMGNSNKYSMDNGVLLKTTNKAEYDQKALQAKQDKYLGNMWGKVEDNLFQQSIQYEMTRIGAYSDFENMEFFPELAATLDILMEESTTVNDKGRVLNIYSDSPRIRGVLEDLFFNRLDIHTVLPMWVRNTPIREDSVIPLLDGSEVTIKELSEMVKGDNDVWTYSIQSETNKLLPGKVVWCDLTRKDSKLVRVTLDNDTHVDTTPDHEYMLRDGSYCRADELQSGVSLMPFYTKVSVERNGTLRGYEKAYNPQSNRYGYTHRLVANDCVTDYNYERGINEHFVTHHADFNKKNNHPINLKRMTFSDHADLHNKHGKILKEYRNRPDVVKKRLAGIDRYLRSDERKEMLSQKMCGTYPKYFEEYNNSDLHSEHNTIRSEAMSSKWSTEEYKESTINKMTLTMDDSSLSFIKNLLIDNEDFIGINKLSNLLRDDLEFISLFTKTHKLRKDPTKSINPRSLPKMIFRETNMDYFEWYKTIKPEINDNKNFITSRKIKLSKDGSKILNHKVIKVETLEETSDVYCMEVHGPNGERDRHNFPVCSKDSNGVYNRDGVFLSNCKYGDNFVYLNTSDKYGIIGAKQMPNFEMERKEGGIYDAISSRLNSSEKESKDRAEEGKEERVRFFWRGRDLEFESWQIAHFRLLGDDRRLPYGTCLKYNTRVETVNGYKEIKDITTNDEVYSFDIDSQTKRPSKVLDTIMSGIKQTYKLSTQHNYIDVSEEHKILYYNVDDKEFKYKNVLDFNIGDLLVVDPTNNNDNDITINKTKPSDNKNGYWNNIDLIPDVIDVDFARLFGCMVGDGWIHNDSVSLALSEHKTLNDKYIDYITKITGRAVKYKNDGQQAIFNSKMLSTILTRMGFVGDVYTKRIPSWVYSASIEVRRAFLEGLVDADGSLHIDKWDCLRYSIELANEELINDIKVLVQSLGLKSGKISNRLRVDNGMGDRKFKTTKESFYFYFFDSKVTQKVKYDLDGRLGDGFILEPIKSIVESGEHETYDIYVEDSNHNFYSNGIVTHNSVLEKSRRIWKQLLLSEDAMLVYRVTRAPERRVYKIYVGNIDDEDVQPYVNEIANRFKRASVIDPQTGQVDLKYNQLANDQDFFIPVRDENAPNPIDTLPGACIALDTRIPLLDGRTLELQEIIQEWDNGNRDLWVYSCDPNTGELAAGMITWAGETRQNAEVLKITLDNGETLTTTPDHKWVHRTKGFTEAKDLVVGDSLMPFYWDEKKIRSNTNEYERVWDSHKQEWVFTHRMVIDSLNGKGLIKEFTHDNTFDGKPKLIRHHKDHNRFNNNPDNLVWMNGGDHMKYHQSVIMDTVWGNPEENITKITDGMNNFIANQTEEERLIRAEQSKSNSINSRDKANETFDKNPNKENILKSRGNAISEAKSTEEFKEKFSPIAKANWESDEYREKVFSKKQTITFTDELYTMYLEMFKLYGKADLTLAELNNSEDFITEFANSNEGIRSSLTNLNEFTRNHLDKMIKSRGFKNYREWCKVTAEELGYKNVRAWRYFIDKNNKLELEANYNHKIIAIEWLEDKIDTGTITVDGDELYHNYHTFACESGVYVKNSNLDQIADIEYLQRKLFTALRVPKSFLGFDDQQGDGKNLALMDVRFARTINRIQQALLQELNKIAIIHLFLLGFEDELNGFTITMNNPSTQAEMLRVEHLQSKFTAIQSAVADAGNGFGIMSMTRAKRDILGWGDEEIKQDLLEQRMEKAAASELANTASVIKNTGLFDKVDKMHGDMDAAREGGQSAEEGDDAGGAAGGGGFGGGGMGGDDIDFGDEDLEDTGDEGGDFGGAEDLGAEDLGGEEVDVDAEVDAPMGEMLKIGKQVLAEDRVILAEKHKRRKERGKDIYYNRLMESLSGNNETEMTVNANRVGLADKAFGINQGVNEMLTDIEKIIKPEE